MIEEQAAEEDKMQEGTVTEKMQEDVEEVMETWADEEKQMAPTVPTPKSCSFIDGHPSTTS